MPPLISLPPTVAVRYPGKLRLLRLFSSDGLGAGESSSVTLFPRQWLSSSDLPYAFSATYHWATHSSLGSKVEQKLQKVISFHIATLASDVRSINMYIDHTIKELFDAAAENLMHITVSSRTLS